MTRVACSSPRLRLLLLANPVFCLHEDLDALNALHPHVGRQLDRELVRAADGAPLELTARHIGDIGSVEAIGNRIEPFFRSKRLARLDDGDRDVESSPILLVARDPGWTGVPEIIANERFGVAG